MKETFKGQQRQKSDKTQNFWKCPNWEEAILNIILTKTGVGKRKDKKQDMKK